MFDTDPTRNPSLLSRAWRGSQARQLSSLALAVLTPLAGASSFPCLSHGDTTTVNIIPDLTPDGVPVGAQIAGPRTFWDADLFVDDFIGGVRKGESTATVTNMGRQLINKYGHVMNGGLDGACIEVVTRVNLRYPVEKCVGKSRSSTVGGSVGGASSSSTQGSSVTHCVTVWEISEFTFGPSELCPCE